MLVELKYPRRIEGVSYAPGIHEVSEELRGHWYLKALVINGDAFIRSEPDSGDDEVSSVDDVVEKKAKSKKGNKKKDE